MNSIATILAVLAGVTAVAINNPRPLEARQGNYAIQNWGNDYADYDFESGAGGKFSIDWNNPPGGNFVAGKGVHGQEMLFNYSGTFKVNGNAYLALYGWTINPLVEYYVIESMGHHNPSDNASATQYGMVESDGGMYEIWMKIRTNAPSIIGTATFAQYWSIRTKMHCGGTINTGNHFKAWEAAGLPLGTQQNMFLAIEGQQGSGTANITVGVAPTTPVPETTTSTQRTETRRTTTRTSSKTSSKTSAPATTTSSRSVVTTTSSKPSTTPVRTTTKSTTPVVTTTKSTTPVPTTTKSTTPVVTTTKSTTPIPTTTKSTTPVPTTTKSTTASTSKATTTGSVRTTSESTVTTRGCGFPWC